MRPQKKLRNLQLIL